MPGARAAHNEGGGEAFPLFSVATGRCGRPANLELLSPVLASGRRRRKEPPDPAPPRPDPVVAQLWKMVAVALAGVCGAGGGGGRRSDFDRA